jgi:hypothetical protein
MPHKDLKAALKGYPKEVILKNGTGVTLRPLGPGDEKGLFNMFERLSEDELWFLNHDVSDPKLIDAWIRDLDPDRVVSIVAILEGKFIANSVLMMKTYGAKGHIGKVRITVVPSFRENRLGTWMLFDLVNLGMDIGLQILVIRLVEDMDASVIHSVKKIGFVEEFLLKNYFLDKEGNPHNLITLTKRLSTEWGDF